MKYIPYPHIELILTTRADVLEAIIATLPVKPALVQTPKLLSIMTGDTWKEATMVSHDLIKLYCATCLYIETLPKWEGKHFPRVKQALQQDQRTAYEYVDNKERFILEYLNAYEKALIKYLHLFKVGGNVSLEAEDGKPPITYFILTMTDETLHELRFHELLTSSVLSTRSKRLDTLEHNLEALHSHMSALKVS